MFKAFMRSAKLASIGELATGLAHEINNPLAIISADQTNISDIISDMDTEWDGLRKIDESLQRCKRQVARLSHGQRSGDGLGVAHLTDEDDVGILPENVSQACRK